MNDDSKKYLGSNLQALVKFFAIAIIACVFVKLCLPYMSQPALRILNKLDFYSLKTALIVLGVLATVLSLAPVSIYVSRYLNTKLKSPFAITGVEKASLLIIAVGIVFYEKITHRIQISPTFDFSSSFLISIAYALTVYIIVSRLRKDKDKNNSRDLTLVDEPIENLRQDDLGRRKFVIGFYEEIKRMLTPHSFVFGLYGGWGEGKTSILNMLDEHFRKDNKFISVRFEPWFFQNEEAIIRSFYNELNASIASHFICAELKSAIKNYVRLILWGVIQHRFNFNAPGKIEANDISMLKSKIEAALESLNVRMIVMIDDIDRLDESEAALVTKLVRHNSNFKRVIFILSMNDAIVSKKLKERFDGQGESYLDKIVQRPIRLPAVERHHIDNYLFYSDHPIPEYTVFQLLENHVSGEVSVEGMLERDKGGAFSLSSVGNKQKCIKVVVADEKEQDYEKLCGERVFVFGICDGAKIKSAEDKGELRRYRLSCIDNLLKSLYQNQKIEYKDIRDYDQDMSYTYNSHVKRKIRTLRQAKRYLNALYSELPTIVGEVSLYDFFLLEFIKVFYPIVYRDIYQNWWVYSSERFKGEVLTSPFAFLSDETQKKEAINGHLNRLFNSFDTSSEDEEILKGVLSELFKNCRDAVGGYKFSKEKQLGIDSSHFPKYFILNVPSKDVSDAYLRTKIKVWNYSKDAREDIKTTVNEMRENNKLVEFFGSVQKQYAGEIKPTLAEQLIEVVAELSVTYSTYSSDGFYGSEFDRADALILNLLDEKFKGETLSCLIHKLLLDTEDVYLVCGLLLQMNKERDSGLRNIYDAIDHKALAIQLSNRLKEKFINRGEDLFSYFRARKGLGLVCYQWASKWGHDDVDREEVTKYLVGLMKNDIQYFYKFMMEFKSERLNNNSIRVDAETLAKTFDVRKLIEAAEVHVKNEGIPAKTKKWIEEFIKDAKKYISENG